MNSEVCENQWRWPSGWRDACMRIGATGELHEPLPAWTSWDGKSTHPESLPPPPRCKFVSEWEVDRMNVLKRFSGVDDQGWAYSAGFPHEDRLHRGWAASVHPEWQAPVRRRCWYRSWVREVDGTPVDSTSRKTAPVDDVDGRLLAKPGSAATSTVAITSSSSSCSGVCKDLVRGEGSCTRTSRVPLDGTSKGTHDAGSGDAIKQVHACRLVDAGVKCALGVPICGRKVPLRLERDEAVSHLASLSKAVASVVNGCRLIGGESDSEQLRRALNACIEAVEVRLSPLERCILERAAVAAHEVTDSTTGSVSADRSHSSTKLRSSHTQSASAFGAADRSHSVVSQAGAGAHRGSLSGGARLPSADPKRQWSKLGDDCASLRGVLEKCVGRYRAHAASTAIPTPAPASGPSAGARGKDERGSLAAHSSGMHGTHHRVHASGNTHGDTKSDGEPIFLQSMQLASEVDIMSRIVDERTEHIDHVAREVVQVAELFRDISTIVAGQSPAVETIGKNVAEAKAHTAKGVEQLKAAEAIQREGTCIIS